MIIKVLKLPLTIFQFASLSKKSVFTGSDKWSLFLALVKVYFFSEILKINRQPVRIKLMGLEVFAFSYRSLYIFLYEIFISKSYYFKALKNNPYIIDCGANIGLATLFFKKLYPNSTIDCFEPVKSACKMLEKNITVNKLKNITIYNEAVADMDGDVSFFTHHDSGDVVGSVRKDRGGDNEILVKCRRLSAFINGKNVDLLKMDIEGAELKVVYDLHQSGTFKNIDNCVMEYHHKIGNEPACMGKFLTKFEDFGFDYNIATGFKKLNQFQDINIHFYKNGINKPGAVNNDGRTDFETTV